MPWLAAELVIAVSDADRDLFVAHYAADPARVVVAPNGADTDTYTPSDDRARRRAKRRLGLPDKPTVIFAGGDVAPNRAGLRHVERLANLTDRFTFLVVGPVARPRRGGNVVATGFVEDLRLHLQAADLAICPIEHGGGTKIKLLEALAAGLPDGRLPGGDPWLGSPPRPARDGGRQDAAGHALPLSMSSPGTEPWPTR